MKNLKHTNFFYDKNDYTFQYLTTDQLEGLVDKEICFLGYGNALKVSIVIKNGKDYLVNFCGLCKATTVKILY